MLSREELILSSGTVGNPPLDGLIEAATAGGYNSVVIWPADYLQWRESGISDPEARVRLDAAGISVAQVDCLLMWTLNPGSKRAAAEEADVFAAASAFGASVVSVIGPGDDRFSVDQLAETLAGTCDRGAERGFDIALEVAPWKGNVDLETAVRLIKATGRSNAGLVIDSWHMYRGATPAAQIAAVPGEMVASIQISDAPSAAGPDLVAETMGARLLPGHGEIDLKAFLLALDSQSAGVALTVEVLSDELRGAGPVEAGRLTGQATREVIAASLVD
jgi:sugar phosphate isomerase/epimerase